MEQVRMLQLSKFIEETVLVSFDIKIIRRHQNQRRNGEACQFSSEIASKGIA